MRTNKFLSVLLAVSMLSSLFIGAAQANSDNVHTVSPNRLNYNRSLTDVDGNTVNVTASGKSKLLVFTSSDNADGKSLCGFLNTASAGAQADIVIVFTDSAATKAVVTTYESEYAIANAKYVPSFTENKTDELYSAYADLISTTALPLAVDINSSDRICQITTGYDDDVTDAISIGLGLNAGTTTNIISTDGSVSADEWTVLRLTNKARAANAKEPLTLSAAAQKAAHSRAKELIKSYKNTRPNGDTASTVCGDVGLSVSQYAENYVSGPSSAEASYSSFYRTALQKDNMLSSSYKHAGIGCVDSVNGLYWTQTLFDNTCVISAVKQIDMPQITTTTDNGDGTTTTTETPKTFPTGTSIDDMGGTVHLTCSAHPSEDWICPLTSELCTGFDSTKAGTQTVTVTAYGKTSTFTVTLTPANQTVTGIAINQKATTLSFKEGDALDTTGLEVTISYSDGSSETVENTDARLSYAPLKLTTAGTQTITISCSGKTATYKVTVIASVKVTGIAVKTLPTKTTYEVGSSLETAGLTLTETLSDGTTQIVSDMEPGFSCSPTKLSALGNTIPITVTCGGQTTTFTVKVVQSLTVESISIRTAAKKTSYIAGETVDATGLAINATMTDGTVKAVTTGFTWSPCAPTALTADDTAVTVTYENKTVSYAISVSPVTVSTLTVTTKPDTLKYYQNATLDTTGLVLTATMNNKTTQKVTEGFTCSPTTLDKVGNQIITVSYGGKTATFSVTVAEPTVTAIAIKTKPTTTGYVKGTSLNTAGLTLTASMSDGTTQTISTGFTCSPTKLSTVGTQTVTVSYKSKTATFTVSVVESTVSTLTLTTKPTKLSYYRDETLVTTGMVLTAAMTDGTSKKVTSGFTCTPTTLSSTGTQTITVTYGNKSVSFTVSVTAPVIASITVKAKPTLVKYNQGNTLQTAGLTLTATTENKTKIDNITSGFTCTPMLLSAGGTQTITVSYGGKTASFTVAVKEKTANAAFVDVVAGQWFYEYVNDLTKRGLLSGTYNNDGTYSFRPESSISRAEFVTLLARASGLNMSSYDYSSFSDVPLSNWACTYVTWAYVNGIVTGSGTLFRPDDNVTRQEMAVILTRFNNYLKKSMDMEITPITFADDASIASWARNSVIMMQKAGIINGILNKDGSYSFYPEDNATRAQAAKVVSVFLSK